MGEINIFQGKYDIIHNEIRYYKSFIKILPRRFNDLLIEKATKFFYKYNMKNRKIMVEYFEFTIAVDFENNIWSIAISHPFLDAYNENLGKKIAIGRVKRMRGDLKYDRTNPQRDKHGNIILDEEGNPIMYNRVRYYRPYNLDEKIVRKRKETLKYPYIYKKK